MSRRLSKKSRAAKLSKALAAKSTHLDALEAQFARSFARQPSRYSALLTGTALSAGVLAASVGATLIDVRPAAAGTCTPSAGSSPYTTVWDCEGNFPGGIAFPGQTVSTLVETGLTTNPKIGQNGFGNGIGMTAGANNLTLGITTSGNTTIGTPAGAGYSISHDGIFLASFFHTGITLNVNNAAPIGVGNTGIHTSIIDGNETHNDSINIVNASTGTINGGNNGNGITAILIAEVNTQLLPNAVNTITINNAAAMGNATNYIGHDGIFSLLIKSPCESTECGTGTQVVNSITGNNTVTNSGPMFTNGTSLHAITIVSDIPGGQATAVSNVYNSGALHSAFANGIHAFAQSYSQHGTANSVIAITNAATAPIYAHLEGIDFTANALTPGNTGPLSSTGGNSTATVTVSNAGNITGSGNATITALGARRGIEGDALAGADSNFFGANPSQGTGGTAKAQVSVFNSGTIKSRYAGINITGTAHANGFGNVTYGNASVRGNSSAHGGVALANVTISNAATGTITTGPTAGQGIEGHSYADANAGKAFGSKYGRPATAVGGSASAFTSISNAANINSYHHAIDGTAHADAVAFAYTGGNTSTAGVPVTGTGKAGNATGGTSVALVVISNTGNMSTDGNTSGDAVVFGQSEADSNAHGYHAQGGTANAITEIVNSQSLKGDWGIYGNATATANAEGNTTAPGGTATGGNSSADVGITNTGNITATNHRGISSYSYASSSASGYTATGGSSFAGVEITNSGNISSHFKGIYGGAVAKANAFGAESGNATKGTFGSAKGGTANAGVSISNGGNLTITSSNGHGVFGYSKAEAFADAYKATGGTANAGTAVSNFGNVTSWRTAVYGGAVAIAGGYGRHHAKGGSGQGGIANAGVFITNAGTLMSYDGHGIKGNSTAHAKGKGYTAHGGTANAYTVISNSGTIMKAYDGGIDGRATAKAGGYGNLSKGSGTGGTAHALVLIHNTAPIYNVNSSSIRGDAKANAKGKGFTAQGGNATAATIIYNGPGGTLLSVEYTAIHGKARANASGIAPIDTKGSKGTGGSAAAGVTITNLGSLQAGDGGDYMSGIDASAKAKAVGVGYTGLGGSADAAALVTNFGNISTFYGSGIKGNATADASGIGDKDAMKGKGVGGTADAYTFITNTGVITSHSDDNYGIWGYSKAKAVGVGWTAIGGTAEAITHITNIGAIRDQGTGIYGGAVAKAGAYSGNSSCVEPCNAKGGYAVAQTVIVNHGNMFSIDETGIDGFSKARADAEAVQATGGTANAGTFITNTGNINGSGNESGVDGIDGEAIASASAHGSYGIMGAATGGTALATLFITNSGTLYVSGEGITGFAGAFANGEGRGGIGGTAFASSTILNTGLIVAGSGIENSTVAEANGYYRGGTASAVTIVTNSGAMKVYSDDSAGISARSKAEASGGSDYSTGGTAVALTIVSNAGNIETFSDDSPGIKAKSSAEAFGFSGGTAMAATYVTNVATIATSFKSGGHSDGIDAHSFAGSSGTSIAITKVTNTGPITTFGSHSDAIHASSFALADAAPGITASAATVVSNTGALTGLSWRSDGIEAFAGAKAYGFNIGLDAAFTEVINSGTILMDEGHSYGIKAKSLCIGDCTATTNVENFGNITTLEHHSPALYAGSYAGGGVFSGNATALTGVSNSGALTTKGSHSAGMLLYAGAGSVSGTATATILTSNSGAITTYGRHSDGISAYVFVGATGTGVALIDVSNSGTVVTNGKHSNAIYAGVNSKANGGSAAIDIENSGDIAALGGWHQFGYHAIVSSGAPTYIISSGVIQGNLQLAKGKKNTFNNTGEWDMQGDSAFGGNVKSAVNNEALVKVVGPGASRYSPDLATLGAPEHVTTVFGLESFNNNGVVDLSFGGRTNNRLVLSNYTDAGRKVYFNGGPGSTLIVNARLGGPAAPTTYTVVITTTSGSTSTTTSSGGFSGGVSGSLYTYSSNNNETCPGNASSCTTTTGNLSGNLSGNFSSTSKTTTSGTTSTTVTKAVTTYVVTSQADVLQVGGLKKGNLAPGYVSGITKIVVNDKAPNLAGSFNPVGIPIVESSGAVISSSGINVAGNFVLANGPIQKGFFEYSLFYLPGTTQSTCVSGFNCWFLASTPGTAGEEFTQLGTAANDIWREAAGLWLDRTADLRDYFLYSAGTSCDARGGGADLPVKARPCVPIPGGVGPGVWLRAYGDWIKNNQNATFGAFGQNVSSDVNYSQNIGGVQMGADWAFMRAGYSVVLAGLLGGASESTVNFASGTKVTFQGGDAGAYATFINHGFFADALVMGNWMSMDYTSSGIPFIGLGIPNLGQNVNLQQYGGRIDSGYRFQFNPWFVEPQLAAEIVHTNFGTFNFPQVATTIQVQNDTSVAGRLGGRVGTTWLTGGWRIEPSVFGGVWEYFQGNNGAVLTNNGFALDLTAPNVKSVGEVGGMLNFFQVGNTMSAFVKGEYRFGDQYSSGSVSGGVRYQWP